MLGIGPILWAEANRRMYGNPRASGAEPVDRPEAWIHEDTDGTTNPRFRYRAPAAWWYYQQIDEINRRFYPTVGDERA